MPRLRIPAAAGAAVLAVAVPAVWAAEAAPAPAPNPIQVENARSGTTSWRVRLLPQHVLEGYASEVSVAPGDTLHLHVSSSAGLRYQVRIFRIGWYGGTGGRRMPCRPCRPHTAKAEPLPAPDPATGLLRLPWPVTDAVPIGANWVSGYYLADLVTRGGRGSWVPVRRPGSRVEALGDPRPGRGEHLAGVQPLGRTQPVLEPHRRRRRPRLVRPAVRRCTARRARAAAARTCRRRGSSRSSTSSSATATTSRTRPTWTRTATRPSSSATAS